MRDGPHTRGSLAGRRADRAQPHVGAGPAAFIATLRERADRRACGAEAARLHTQNCSIRRARQHDSRSRHRACDPMGRSTDTHAERMLSLEPRSLVEEQLLATLQDTQRNVTLSTRPANARRKQGGADGAWKGRGPSSARGSDVPLAPAKTATACAVTRPDSGHDDRISDSMVLRAAAESRYGFGDGRERCDAPMPALHKAV